MNEPIQSAKTVDRPLVSVIIIFLNAERFLPEAVESVFAQTFNAWELILVDDGSTDGSTAIARNYAEQWPAKVRYLQHPGHQNRGTGASRNLGVAHAKGKYIAFLDADDVWLPHKLEQQVAILESYPEAAMVYGLTQWWYSWTGKPEDSGRDFTHRLGVPANKLIGPPALIRPFFLTQEAMIPSMSNFLIRRAVVEELGGFDESFRGTYEDQALYAKICLAAPVLASDECWDRYRQHADSICANEMRSGKDIRSRMFFLNWLEKYLTGQGFKDMKTLGLLRREIWVHRYPILHYFVRDRKRNVSRMKDVLFSISGRMLPAPIRNWLWARRQGEKYCPPVGWVYLGNLRRVTPFSRQYGYDRGRPIDRCYIEQFLLEHQRDIRGRVLEVAENTYTRQFGGEHVTESDVLHISPGDPGATIIGDLTCADHIPSDTFDCVILTQTLQVIYDVRVALQTIHRILKPGGVVIATFPGLSPISRYDMERWGYYWGFTSLSARRLFEEVFPPEDVHIRAYGNVLTATAFLYGMATEELRQEEMEYFDPDYEVTIAVRARKLG